MLATGIPILDRGGFFARLKPQRSYCMAYRVPGEHHQRHVHLDRLPHPVCALCTDRRRPAPDRRRAPGIRWDTRSIRRRRCRSWTPGRKVHYPGAMQTHYWSAQDYSPIDELPYVGPILPGNDKIFVATGFDKWGMTNGTAAALALSSRILGGRMEWAEAFASWSPHELSGIPKAMQANLEVGLYLAKGWITPVTRIGRPHARRTVASSAARRGISRAAAWWTAWSTGCRRCARTSAAS